MSELHRFENCDSGREKLRVDVKDWLSTRATLRLDVAGDDPSVISAQLTNNLMFNETYEEQ